MSVQIFVGVSMPALLILGFVIAIILLIFGFMEKKNPLRKKRLLAAGTILFGIMIVAVPLSWYGYWAIASGGILVNISDIVIITFLSLIGGIIISFGIEFNRAKEEKTN